MAKIIGYINLYDSPSLGNLTRKRTLASTSFLGRFALIDFALSNYANANINNINILIKEDYRSVAKHCGDLSAWISNTKIGRQSFLINEKGIANPDYNSDLNAIRENEWVLERADADYVVIQPSHMITNINITDLLESHITSGAGITMAYASINDGDKAFLSSNKLTLEGNKIVSSVRNDGSEKKVNVSLRTYVFSREIFNKILTHKDFKKAMSLRNLLEHIVNDEKILVNGYKYEGYARCVDSFEHFYEYSLELLDPKVSNELFCKKNTVYTISKNTPPATYGANANVRNTFVANGSKVFGHVENSIISRYVVVEEGATVKNCIVMSGSVVKSGVSLENVVVDKRTKVVESLKGSKGNPLYIK